MHQPLLYLLEIVFKKRMELEKHVLRPLDRAGYQLRVEHHVQCVNPEMLLGRLVATVHLDGVAHGLKCME
ncbi:hypothetical protein D3C87_1604450 [compost metagenome]